MKRFAYIDAMKAIGIVLIVLGHAPGLNPSIKNVIYSFHMPLFFFISGALLSEQKLSLPYRAYLASLWKGLGLPYLFFFAISYLYWLPTHDLAASATKYVGISWWEPLMGVVIGNGDALFVNVVLWFFTCLITTSLVYFAARKYFSATLLFFAMNLAGWFFSLLYNPIWPRLPWGLDNAVVALGFYSAGHLFRQYQHVFVTNCARRSAIVFALGMLVSVVYFAWLNGAVDLNTLHFGNYPALYFISGYLGIFALLYFALHFPVNAVFQWLSKNTIIIFPLHLLMFSALTGIAVLVFEMPVGFKESSPVWTALFPAMALLLSYPAALFLYRFFPQIFGTRRRDVQIIAPIGQGDSILERPIAVLNRKPNFMKRLLGAK